MAVRGAEARALITAAVDALGCPARYGQPSPALIERARRGWQRLDSLHERLRQADAR
ncbi:hypothetical protein AB0469_14475 [Streptomyces sp. NPDC093801]|uniref:hypothetical protein n=1 Tax=Streptomyces sp. NPDC093801 TaxID=3155203 RepID=UPI00344FE002